MHPSLKQAHELLEARRPSLRCSMFNYTVEVLHGDGSHFLFHNASLKKVRLHNKDIKQGYNDMLLIWTEHCGYHAFFCEDLEFWRKYSTME